jgi:hypothetical protein
MHESYEDEFDVAHNKELTNCFEDTEVSDIEPYEPELFWQELNPTFPPIAGAFGAHVDRCE